jgi:putative transposase
MDKVKISLERRHRRSIRLRNYDYSQAGGYFVTICTHQRGCLLGEITDENTELSKIGKIAQECWFEIPKHFGDVQLDEFVVMPNHVHGIIIINQRISVGTDYNLSLRRQNRFRNVIAESLSYVVAGFKSAVTRKINRSKNTSHPLAWQSRFYDHIIRNEAELNRIRQYIITNPLKWELDRENPLSTNYNLELKRYFDGIYE